MIKKLTILMLALFLITILYSTVLSAQAEGSTAVAEKPLKETSPEVAKWALIIAGLAMAIASSVGAIAQSKAVITACKGIARNPGASKDIRGALLIGLVLIESLVLYTLVVVFVKL